MDADLNRDELEKKLRMQREELVAFAEDFGRNYDVETFSAEELDLWIERLRPIRLEIRAIDNKLRELSG